MATLTNCTQGVYDCSYDSGSDVCANYDGKYSDIGNTVWPVVLSGMVMCLNSFSLGANDAANAWGAAVGSGAISVKWAVIISAICDFIGAVTLGYGVSDTIQKGISDIEDKSCWACGYCDSNMSLYSVGMFGAGLSASLFIFVCSLLQMPVSGTHAIVGAVIGMTATGVSFDCIDWSIDGGLGAIMLSWVASPILAGIIAIIVYVATQRLIFDASQPRDRALQSLPFFYSLVTALITFTIMTKSPAIKVGEMYAYIVTSIVLIAMVAVTVFLINPYVTARLPSKKLRIKVPNPMSLLETALAYSPHRRFRAPHKQGDHSDGDHADVTSTTEHEGASRRFGFGGDNRPLSPLSSTVPSASAAHEHSIELIEKSSSPRSDANGEHSADVDTPGKTKILKANTTQNASRMGYSRLDVDSNREDAMFCFRYLIVYAAALASFAHGANDTSNSTAPFSAVYSIYSEGIASCESLGSPIWVMAVAGLCSAAGVISLGYKVIATIGKDITQLDYHKGFCASFAAVVTVVLGTIFNLPLSTTHCAIGGVIAVGLVAPLLNRSEAASAASTDPASVVISTNTYTTSSASGSDSPYDDIVLSETEYSLQVSGRGPADGEDIGKNSAHSTTPLDKDGTANDTNGTSSSDATGGPGDGRAVSYSVITKILASWFVTVPVAALLSAIFLVMFRDTVQ